MSKIQVRTFVVLGVAALGAVGCSDDTSTSGSGTGGGGGGGGGTQAEPRFVSGTRLKITVQQAGDVQQYASTTDTELGVRCDAFPASDGSLRCVPSSDGYLAYTDAACTKPVMIYTANTGACVPSTLPKYVSEYLGVGDACSLTTSTHTYEVGAKLATPPAMLYAQVTNSGCVAQGANTSDGYAVTEVAPDVLAPLERVPSARGDGLEVDYWQGPDGYRLMDYYPRDTKRAQICYPGELGEGRGCLPLVSYGTAPAYSDAACMTEVAAGMVTYATACTKPDVTVVTTPDAADACVFATHVYTVGAAATGGYALVGGGTTCSMLGGPESSYALVGAQLPDTDFPATELVDEGTGKVRLRADQAGGQPLSPSGQFVTDTGTLCFPYPFADGVTRCGPPTLAFVPGPGARFYSDAACTKSAAQVYSSDCSTAAPEYAVVVPSDAMCSGLEPHALGAEHTGGIFVSDGGGGCVAATRDPSSTYFLVGEVTPVDQFVEVTAVQL